MRTARLVYAVLTLVLLAASVYLYIKGVHLKSESFGRGLAYVIPAVACFGLAVVTGCMALLEAATKNSPSLGRVSG